MGNRIKLTEPGSEHTMLIAKVTLNQSGSWPDHEFHDAEGNVLGVPVKSMERQLERLEVKTAEELIGAWVKFSRSTEAGKNGKYFWNADLASPPKGASKRIPPPSGAPPQGSGKLLPFDEGYEAAAPNLAPNPANKALHVGMSAPPNAPLQGEEDEPTPLDAKSSLEQVQRDALTDAYGDLYERMLSRMGHAHREDGKTVPLDSMAVQAATATVWIAFDKLGLQRGIISDAAQRHAQEAE